MKAILVGSGGIARQLLQRLGERWVVTMVDTSLERLEAARGLRSFRALEGDGSSLVVLKRAGLEQADAVVAATDDDEANLEICRLALAAGKSRLVAVSNAPERIEMFREIGVTTISPDSLAARRIELNLETRRVSSMAFADGQAEAIEFRIAEDSPVRGKVLSELHAHSWIVGAILRGNQLVIPHGDTVFEAGDLVTVVGAGADFAEIVRTFTSGEGRFPLDFGKRVAVALSSRKDLDGPFREAVQLVRNSRASSVLTVHRNPESLRDEERADQVRELLDAAPELAEGVSLRLRPVESEPAAALAKLPAVESVGVIVVSAPPGGGARSWARIRRAAALVSRTGRPVLISRGSTPYRRILVPARRTSAGRASIRAAIDLARFAKAELRGVAVIDPIFISGPGAPLEAKNSIAWLEEEAAVHGVAVEGVIVRGNPVRMLQREAEQVDLVILGIHARYRPFSLRMGIAGYVARRTDRSVLLIPV